MPLSTKRLFALDADNQAPISFAWANFDGSQTIYITSSDTLNAITITITNNTTGPLTIPGGAPYPMQGTEGSAGVFYLQFVSQYIPADDVQEIIWAGETGGVNWQGESFYDTQDGRYLAIAPLYDVIIGEGDNIILTLSNVKTPDVNQPAPGGSVTFSYVNITGIPGGYGSTGLQVPLLNPPSPQNQDLSPTVGFAENDLIFIGTEPNSINLYITNSQASAITLNSIPTSPVFTLSFVYGTDAGALTTTENADFSVTIAGDNSNNWKVIPNNSGPAPYWQFLPLTTTVLGIDDDASVEISIGNIITQLDPGITTVIIAWTGIDGYNDGEVAVDLIKVNPIIINTFDVSTTTINNPSGPTSVTITYDVSNATFVTITNTQQTNNAELSGSISVSITTTTVFTLIASNLYTGQQTASAVTVTVSPDLYSLLPLGTVVMWAGGITNIPSGWALCDGATVSSPAPEGWQPGPGMSPPPAGSWILPDLRDQFVLGAGGNLAPNTATAGGPDEHTHSITIASQSFDTSTNGSHTHSMTFNTTGCMSYGSTSHYTLYYGRYSNNSIGTVDSTNSQDTSTDGSHSHSVSVGFNNIVSSTQSGGINPPWYSLAFIIKIF